MKLGYQKNMHLEEDVETYLDMIVRGALLFYQGINLYLQGRYDEFEQRLDILAKLENKADVQLRDLEGNLFTQEAMREWRGDILGLMENTDDVINKMQKTLKQFSAEIPHVPPEFQNGCRDLAESSARAVESMVAALRAYFRDYKLVRQNIEMVMELKKTTLAIAEKLSRSIYNFNMELDQKIHLNYFACQIEAVAEMAENVCDRLAIATIKRYSG